MRAGLDEDRVMEMDRPELLEAAAKELAKELTGDTCLLYTSDAADE